MKNLEQQADLLVEKHHEATMSFLNERQKRLNSIRNAIESVNHTISVLEELSEKTKIQDMYEENICDALDEQLELKKILEGRL